MHKPNSTMVAEALESLHGGLIGFLAPKLSLPDPDWKEVVEPSIHPAFLPIMRRKIKDGAAPSLEILDLPSLLKIITFNWKRHFDDLGHQAKNHFFEALDIRNKIAHREAQDLSDEDSLRALDTLKRLAEGRIPVEGLITLNPPQDCQDVYQALLNRTAEGLFQVFDWHNNKAEF